jgi:hypothetical protein
VVLVATFLPSGDFFYQSLFVRDPLIEALARQDAEFRLGHIQPTAVLGRIVPLEALDQPPRFGSGKAS